MKAYKVPIKVTTMGWVMIRAEGMRDAVLIAEHMQGHTVVRPKWELILKDKQEAYTVDTERVEEIAGVQEEFILEPA